MRWLDCVLSILEEPLLSLYDLSPEEQKHNWPFYAVLLFSKSNKKDKDLAEFIETTTDLDAWTGGQCLVGVPQNPEQWDEKWHKRWKARLEKRGIDYNMAMSQWDDADDSETLSHRWAENLGIPKKLIPCIVFMEQYPPDRTLNIPIPRDKEYFRDFFGEVFTAVQRVEAKYPIERDGVRIIYPPEQRIRELQKEWRYHGWLRWQAAPWLKPRLAAFNEWGSLILYMPEQVISQVILPLTK
jgi:hypothetical protein